MTIPDSLLAAIIANKSDDVPRLIAADWLDEHGDCERAEFIRVQCELAKVERGGAWPWCFQRQSELFYGQRGAWFPIIVGWITTLGPVVPNPHRGTMLVTRGFVSAITCSWADWLTHADAILKATPLERVRLTTEPDTAMYEPFQQQWPGIEFELPRAAQAVFPYQRVTPEQFMERLTQDIESRPFFTPAH